MSEKTKQPTIVRTVATKPTPLGPSLGDLPQSRAWSIPITLPVLYFSFVPIAEYAARLQLVTPILEGAMHPVMWGLSGFDANYTRGTNSGRMAIQISLFYAVAVWVGSVVLSVIGQSIGRPEGYQNRAPRQGKTSLTGLPHRLVALHENLMEIYPLFALAALFTQIVDPTNPHLIELLGLHVLSKTALYIPFYAADWGFSRSLSHFMGFTALYAMDDLKAVNLWFRVRTDIDVISTQIMGCFGVNPVMALLVNASQIYCWMPPSVMAMECGLWYAENGEIYNGFRTKSMGNPSILLANPTWNGEFHQVEWRWAHSWTKFGGDSTHDGFLRVLFRKPARGRQIDMSAVRGTVVLGEGQGYFHGMECSKAEGQWSWGIKVDWHVGDAAFWARTMFIYTGVENDDQGNPFIGCEAIEQTGFRGDTLHVVGKRDSNKLTGEEIGILGFNMTGRDFRAFANDRYGKKHQIMVSDYEDCGSSSEDEEVEKGM